MSMRFSAAGVGWRLFDCNFAKTNWSIGVRIQGSFSRGGCGFASGLKDQKLRSASDACALSVEAAVFPISGPSYGAPRSIQRLNAAIVGSGSFGRLNGMKGFSRWAIVE